MSRIVLSAALVAAPLSLTACESMGWAGTPEANGSASASRGEFVNVMLAGHNEARRAYGTAPLAWDPALAADAARYAQEMARTGIYRHSLKASRSSKQGENIWRGSRGAFSYRTMVDLFVDERRYFQRGPFPYNSSTGNWADVGHYTAVIWPTTTRVGCAIATGQRDDYLVCRYFPSGNRDGVRL